MSSHNPKASAQQRADQIQGFTQELTILEQQEIITLTIEQKNKLNQFHQNLLSQFKSTLNIDTSNEEKHLSLGLQIVSFLGALALAASVFFLFYQYWGYLSTPWKITALLIASASSFASIGIVNRIDASGYYVKLAALIAFACFVLNIMMLGSIFNITSSANAFLVFSAYAFLLAYAFNVRVLLGTALLNFFIFMGAKTGTFWGLYWVNTGEAPELFLLPTLLTFCIPFIKKQLNYFGFTSIYHILSACAFFTSILILSNWGYGSLLPWDKDIIEGFYQTLGFACSGGLIYLGIKKQLSHLTFTGNAFFTLFLYTKLFDWWWDVIPKSVFFLIVGLVAILSMLVIQRFRSRLQGASV